MDTLLQDLRYAIRQLRTSPSFTVMAVLALAFGIGATAAIFSVVNGVLLRPLPYADADRLVLLVEKSERPQLPKMWVSIPNFEDWRARNRSFAIGREIHALDANLPLGEARVLQQLVADSMAPRRLQVVLLCVFAATALLLASLGTYGVVAYAAARRTHEIGIRMALGAERGQVLRMIVRQGVILTLTGLAIGLVVALTLTRTIRSQLFEVSPTDPLTFASITAVITVVALVASYLPARRATRVDPLVALRSE